ncbi:MAG: carboxy terminal-processing peptidase [Pirellulaceae bacterium]
MLGIIRSHRWHLVGVMVGTLTLSWLWSPLAPSAPLTKPSQQAERITHAVRVMLQNHLSKHALDDEISRRAMKAYLEGFDPRKMYFYQSDVDEFHRRLTKLDDEIKASKIDFAYIVFNRFLERLDERIKLVDELVNAQHDFTVDEELVIEPEMLRYPQDAAEARERWRKLIKYNLLTMKVDKVEDQEARAKIGRRYHSAARRWKQTDGEELLERYLTAVTASYDPHTTYMSPTNLDNFEIVMRLNLDGIGAALQQDFDENHTVVSSIVPGGAAAKHGKLKKDDRIISVSGPDGTMVDVSEMRLNDVVKMIRGPAGTVVKLGVMPKGSTEVQYYSITRAKIELEDSAARGQVLERGQKTDGSPFRIGFISLPSFYMDMKAARNEDGNGDFRSTTRDVARILKDFTTQGVDVVMLDLRNNGGGSLTEAIRLTGLFIDEGPVVQIKDAAQHVQSYDDLDRGMLWGGPLVVITNKFSASASEILAGAIQDYRRGLVVGDESTHGKGTVQSLLEVGRELFPIPNPPKYGALKITMQQFYRPNGDSTQKRGVIPDLVLPSLTNSIAMGEADLDYALDFDRVKSAQYDSLNLVTSDVIGALRAHSEARITQSSDFAKLSRDISRFKVIKDAKTIPLNEEKYRARRDSERDAEKEEEKQLEDTAAAKNVIFRDDFYDKELVNITLDYVLELQKGKVARAN